MPAAAEITPIIHPRGEAWFLPLRFLLQECLELLPLLIDESKSRHTVYGILRSARKGNPTARRSVHACASFPAVVVTCT